MKSRSIQWNGSVVLPNTKWSAVDSAALTTSVTAIIWRYRLFRCWWVSWWQWKYVQCYCCLHHNHRYLRAHMQGSILAPYCEGDGMDGNNGSAEGTAVDVYVIETHESRLCFFLECRWKLCHLSWFLGPRRSKVSWHRQMQPQWQKMWCQCWLLQLCSITHLLISRWMGYDWWWCYLLRCWWMHIHWWWCCLWQCYL